MSGTVVFPLFSFLSFFHSVFLSFFLLLLFFFGGGGGMNQLNFEVHGPVPRGYYIDLEEPEENALHYVQL